MLPLSRVPLMLGAVVAAASSPRLALASCPTSGWSDPIPMLLGPQDIPSLANGNLDYDNHQSLTWTVVFNQAVLLAQPFVANWFTTAGDSLTMVPALSAPVTYQGLLPSNSWHPDTWTVGNGASPSFAGAVWQTDGSLRFTKPLLSQIRVRCGVGTPAHFVPPWNRKVEGVLHGTGDVVLFKVTQPSGQLLRVGMVPLAITPGGNFDVYADAANPTPGPGTSAWYDATTASDGAFVVPAPSTSRTVHVAVRSAVGAGHFALAVYRTASAAPHQTLKVCSQDALPTLGSSAWNGMRDHLRRASSRLISATEGSRFVHTWNVTKIAPCSGAASDVQFSNCDSTCQVSITPTTVADNCDVPGGQVNQGFQSSGSRYRIPSWGCWSLDLAGSSTTNLHEFGHAFLGGLPDEYVGGNQPWCAHSVMNGPFPWGVMDVFCTDLNHCLDGPASPPGACGQPLWNRMTASGGSWWSTVTGRTADPMTLGPRFGTLVTVNRIP